MTKPVIIQVVGYKSRGKTTLVSRFVSALKKEGYRVGALKHGPHNFEMDKPGSDTWLYNDAGADTVAITSDEKSALIEQGPTSVEDLLRKVGHLDVVLMEGFKKEPYPKIVIVKENTDQALLEQLENVIGVASWKVDHLDVSQPVRSIDDIDGLLKIAMENT